MDFFNMFNQNMSQQHNSNKPVNNETLYKILGIEKNASEKEIKKAYLKKSMRGEYKHPDKGGNKEKFQKLSEAYNVLKDEHKKKLYDKYGDESLKPDFQEPMNMNNLFGMNPFMGQRQSQRMQMTKGKPIIHQINVTLEELCKGITKKMKITRKVIINTISKKIVEPNEMSNIVINCHKCNGQGVINITRQIGPGMIQQIRTNCDLCRGNCKKLKPQYKMIDKSEVVSIYIEKGSEHGDKIKLDGKGNMSPGTLPSDIIFVIVESKNKIFQRKGNDLLIKRKISLTDALCGFEFLIKHPDDRYIVVKSNKLIKDKDIKCISNSGMPLKNDNYSYGKLFIMFSVVYPKESELTPQLKELIKKLFLHVKSFNNLGNNNVQEQLAKLPDEIEIDTEQLQNVDPKLFGHKDRTKSANDSDSDDEQMNTQQCRTM